MPEDTRGFYASTEWSSPTRADTLEHLRSGRLRLEEEHRTHLNSFIAPPASPQETLLETVEGMTPSQRSRLAQLLKPKRDAPRSWFLYMPNGHGGFAEPGNPSPAPSWGAKDSAKAYVDDLKAINPELRYKLMFGGWMSEPKPEPPKPELKIGPFKAGQQGIEWMNATRPDDELDDHWRNIGRAFLGKERK